MCQCWDNLSQRQRPVSHVIACNNNTVVYYIKPKTRNTNHSPFSRSITSFPLFLIWKEFPYACCVRHWAMTSRLNPEPPVTKILYSVCRPSICHHVLPQLANDVSKFSTENASRDTNYAVGYTLEMRDV